MTDMTDAGQRAGTTVSSELRIATTVGVALLSAAVVTAAQYSRERGDLDLSNFTMGVLASVGLLGLALLVRILLPAADGSTTLVSWPGTAGVVGISMMVAVLITDDQASQYSTAAVMIALSIGGFLLTRSAPFVLSAQLGITIGYARLFHDVFFDDGFGGGPSAGSNQIMVIGAGVVVFVIGLTMAGWLLPSTRALSGIVLGTGGVLAIAVLLQSVTIFRTFAAYSDASSISEDGSFDRIRTAVQHNPYVDDVYVVLGYCVLLAAFWAGCAVVTGHVGFRILVIAVLVLSVPMATLALSTQHPTWWEVFLSAVGALVLLRASLLARKRSSGEVPAP